MALPARVDDSAPPYGTLVFDCDSTLASIEGIDELASERKPEIAALTERAMAGEVPLEAVFRRRLELLEPTRDQIAALGARYVAHALPHARELMRALAALGKRVCILSGGLRQAIFALSDELHIDSGDVFAVDVFFDRDGRYAGFDEDSPLARSGGKLELLRQLAREDRRGGVALVGDGATDLEAAPAARRFVAFGGVARREAVFARAVVTCDTPDLAALLPLLVATDELETLARDPSHHPLLRAARVAR
ncbi:MAG: HAD-IB family phosphatase [Planctomycetes bacterium]|nr:HAD-IB family phosphatase [Planctomycetota bacterium]